MTEKIASLKVAEAVQEDVNKGIVRVDSNIMKSIGIHAGDIVEIGGQRKTLAIVDRAYLGDVGLSIIRMDGIIRRNARTGIGEFVKIKKAKVKEAKKVIITLARKGIIVRAPQSLFKQGLLGRPILKGDIVALGGAKTRKQSMLGNPFFDDIFQMLDEGISGFGFSNIKFLVTQTDPKEAVIITENTKVTYDPHATEKTTKEETETFADITYEDIGGLKEEIIKIREMVELPLKHPEIFERLNIEPPKGVLLHGPPGTGKTLLARAVANETQSNFHLINGPEIISKFYGESEANLRKIFEEAEKNSPSIIFIDEIDAIAAKREEATGEVEKRVVAQLLSLMDGLKSRGKVVVIAASNIPNALDPALRRPGRFDREIEINAPNKEGRHTIFKIHTRGMPLAKNISLKELASLTHGFVGADIRALTTEAAMIVLRRIIPNLEWDKDKEIPKEILDKLIVKKEDFNNALKVVRPSALREVLLEVPNTKWDDVGGLDETKQALIESVEWPITNPDGFKRLGINPPKGVLLYGPPGTGKTLLARAVATESQANFISVKGPEILSKFVGESEKAIRKIFQKARQTVPTIIFFDEFDSITSSRTATDEVRNTGRVVDQLLTEMDGIAKNSEIVIIAATNRPDLIDSALLRPGRFDRIILVNIPNQKARENIFKIHTKTMPIAKDVKVKELAKKTENYVGADIEAVCREAGILALKEDKKAKEVNKVHFEEALKKVRSSVTQDIKKGYEELEDKFKSAQGSKVANKTINYFG